MADGTDESGGPDSDDRPDGGTVVGTPGATSPEEAFARLGNAIRVSVLEALHERQRSGDRSDEAVPYTELRRAVGVDDSGKFGYHLNQLLGEFVEKRPGGYVLLAPGRELVRTIKSGAVATTEGVHSAATDAACFRCGAPVTVTYTSGYVVTCCTECRGALDYDLLPPGALSSIPLPPGAVGDAVETAPRALLDRAHGRFCHRARMFGDGICPRCGGQTTPSIEVCTDHDADTGPCEACSVSMPATVRVTCRVCAEGGISPVACVVSHREPFWDALSVAGVDRAGYDAFATMLGWPMSVRDGDDGAAVAYDLPGRSDAVVVDGDLAIRDGV
ncbi:DUF7351 domain-containing protein [Halobaculum marinum]|uniref:Helix-turn-helix domain-containing protein n=1 Tax=Halobaculum marinum TaxID=3031996 RepID=A0ABD5WQX0_9EURY|nr:hypothetical protein [Halobaculum sp. DT55]